MVPVIAFVGRHNSGKTTVLTQVLETLQLMGIKSAVIKHSHHMLTPDGFDSGKLFAAGAQQVYLSTPHEILIYRREEEKSLKAMVAEVLPTVDIVLLEGYKQSSYPKVEVIRYDVDPEPLELTNVIARVTDCEFDDGILQFGFGQEAELVKYLMEQSRKLAEKDPGGAINA